MTRLLKWRWAWELEEDNWSWRRLITGDSWLVYTGWDLLYLRQMKGIIHPPFPQRNHPGDSGKGCLGVLLCVSESSVSHRVTGSHQPTPPPTTTTSGPEPLRAGGISLSPSLSFFFGYVMGLHVSQVVQTDRAWRPLPSASCTDMWTPICNILCWAFHRGYWRVLDTLWSSFLSRGKVRTLLPTHSGTVSFKSGEQKDL